MDLNQLLEEWSVLFPGCWENDLSIFMENWYAVSNDNGIVAYFSNQNDAFRFRLNEINRILNN